MPRNLIRVLQRPTRTAVDPYLGMRVGPRSFGSRSSRLAGPPGARCQLTCCVFDMRCIQPNIGQPPFQLAALHCAPRVGMHHFCVCVCVFKTVGWGFLIKHRKPKVYCNLNAAWKQTSRASKHIHLSCSEKFFFFCSCSCSTPTLECFVF